MQPRRLIVGSVAETADRRLIRLGVRPMRRHAVVKAGASGEETVGFSLHPKFSSVQGTATIQHNYN
jgi:hypothetical protein